LLTCQFILFNGISVNNLMKGYDDTIQAIINN